MARIDEIAPDLFRVSVYAPQFDLQFNHFLINDDEPLLFHTGMRRMFPEVREAVAKVIDLDALRWISWSHFEVDECGALNEWLAVAPRAQAICSQVGAAVNIEDFAERPPRGLAKGEVIETGRHRYRFVPTPHLPHGWDAGVLFEEKSGVLLCSDLFHQIGGSALRVRTARRVRGRQRRPAAMSQRDVAAQVRLARAIDFAHAALTDKGQDFVDSELSSWRQWHASELSAAGL